MDALEQFVYPLSIFIYSSKWYTHEISRSHNLISITK